MGVCTTDTGVRDVWI